MENKRKNKRRKIISNKNNLERLGPLFSYVEWEVGIFLLIIFLFIYYSFYKTNSAFLVPNFMYIYLEFISKYTTLIVPYIAIDMAIYLVDYKNIIKQGFGKNKIFNISDSICKAVILSVVIILGYTDSIFKKVTLIKVFPHYSVIIWISIIIAIIILFVNYKIKRR